MTLRFALTSLIVSGCLLLTGCVTRSVDNQAVSIYYQWWIPIGVFVVGLACVPVGLKVRNQAGPVGWGLIFLGPLAALMFAPALFFEHAVVNDKGFQIRSGFFGRTAAQDLDFDSIKAIRIGTEETRGRNSRWIEVLYFELNRGMMSHFPLNNDVKIEAGKEIIVRAMQRGIPVSETR